MHYLDNSATTRPFNETIEAMVAAMNTEYYNPSAKYAPAMGVSGLMQQTRQNVASAAGLPDAKVWFTGSGTEADNIAIVGAAKAQRGRKARFITTSVEHPAVLESMKMAQELGMETVLLPVDTCGVVYLEALEQALTPETMLVSIMQVNNEVGAVQPVSEALPLIRRLAPKALCHVDGVQGFLRTALPNTVDLYTLSAHKIHGPKGIGALCVHCPPSRLLPVVYGGGQEDGMRSGTENTPGIAGLNAAITAFCALPDPLSRMRRLKTLLWEALQNADIGAEKNGPSIEDGAPHVLNVSFPCRGEVLLHALEADDVLVSTGSACSSHKKTPSATLTAMGLSPRRIEGALRFSLCPMNTEEDILAAVQSLKKNVPLLSAFRRK